MSSVKLAVRLAYLERCCCGNAIRLAAVMRMASGSIQNVHSRGAVGCSHCHTCNLASIKPHRKLFSSMRIGWNLRLSTHGLAEEINSVQARQIFDSQVQLTSTCRPAMRPAAENV